MKRALLDGLLCLMAVLLSLGVARAQNYERMSDVEAELFGDYAVVNGDYQTFKNVRRYWVQQAQQLKTMKQLEFVLTGSNEAILRVTIPSRLLFVPNDSTLLTTADSFLRPILRMAKGDEAVAQLIIAGFTDNNGSDSYLNQMAGGRARQLHRWFAHQGVGPSDVHSFGLGNRVPRTANEDIAQRERNRRVAIYLVPNRRMLKAAKKGALK